MALQDLTPQLRTRLSRMERAVGWFVTLAVVVLASGFVYYVYHTAENKGWFVTKAPYYTFTDRATGLKVGDPVMMMGLTVGQITKMEPMAPESHYNIYVEFAIKDPYYGYLWTEGSRAKVTTADLLGKRVLEVTKGTNGYPAYTFYPLREVSIAELRVWPGLTNWLLAQEVWDQTGTNLIARAKTAITNLNTIAAAGYTNLIVMDQADERKSMTGIWNDQEGRYDPYARKHPPYELVSDESAAVTERLEKLVAEIEHALPNILSLTNQFTLVLSNSASLTSNLNVVAQEARPSVSNLARLTAEMDRPGALGEWLLPTNINRKLEGTLSAGQSALTSANTNLAALAENLNRSLDSLAGITSNLNSQVQANTNILAEISRAIVNADSFVQGLKHHWLLRSAFKTKKTNEPPAAPSAPLRSPKQRGEQ